MDREDERHPYQESRPGVDGKSRHRVAARELAADRYQRNEQRAERTRQLRIRVPEHRKNNWRLRVDRERHDKPNLGASPTGDHPVAMAHSTA